MLQFQDLDLERLREELNEDPQVEAGGVNIINSVVTDSNITLAQTNSAVSIRQPKVSIIASYVYK